MEIAYQEPFHVYTMSHATGLGLDLNPMLSLTQIQAVIAGPDLTSVFF